MTTRPSLREQLEASLAMEGLGAVKRKDYPTLIANIVEGQIRSFLHDHPEVAEAWTGKLAPSISKADAVRASLAKRIVRDLTCGSIIARIREALLEVPNGNVEEHRDLEVDTGAMGAAVEPEPAAALP